jgi:hypothetical protein
MATKGVEDAESRFILLRFLSLLWPRFIFDGSKVGFENRFEWLGSSQPAGGRFPECQQARGLRGKNRFLQPPLNRIFEMEALQPSWKR